MERRLEAEPSWNGRVRQALPMAGLREIAGGQMHNCQLRRAQRTNENRLGEKLTLVASAKHPGQDFLRVSAGRRVVAALTPCASPPPGERLARPDNWSHQGRVNTT